MKILLLPPYFYPEEMSSSLLDEHRYQAFAQSGFDMCAYTPMPTRGVTDEVRKQYKNRCDEVMFDGRMKVHRFALMKEGKNPVGRAIRYFLAFIKQYRLGLKARDVDCIFLVSTPPIQGMLGAFLKKRKRVPFVYNLQDIFPDSLVGAGLARKGGILWKIGRVIENFTYRNTDKIIVISDDFKRNIMAKGVPEEKIEVIYNWVDENAIHPIVDNENPMFEEFGISRDKFRVVYAGNLGNAQNIGLIVDAAARLKDVQFIIFGTGGLESELRARKEKEEIDNLKILPLQPYERVSQVYSLGNVCIVACKPGLGGAAMPSKTWSIMSAGSAVLANFDDGELKSIIEGNACGVFTKAGDLDGFVDAISSLASNPGKCEEMGLSGREFILRNLTKEVGTSKYVEVIKSVAL